MQSIDVNGVEYDIPGRQLMVEAERFFRSRSNRAHRLEVLRQKIRLADAKGNVPAIMKYGAQLLTQGVRKA